MPRPVLARTLAIVSVLGLAASAIVAGCGSDDAANADGDGDGGSSGSSGASSGSSGTSSGSSGTSGGSSGTSGGSSGTSGGSSGTSGGTDADIPDVSFFYDAPVRDSSLSSDSACAQTSATATLKPLDMYVMLDQSGSMGTDCNVGSATASKWCYAVNALSTYFKAPASTGNAAALQYFGLGAGVCGTGAGYDVSEIPAAGTGYQALPSSTFDTSLNTHSPSTNTPTEGALRGIVGFTKKAVNQRAGRVTIGILITDGDPQTCITTPSTLATILSDHYAATGIRTFVIGMTGATFANLETIAVGGNAPAHADNIGGLTDTCGNGAGPCRHWNVGAGNGATFTEALKQIQAAAIGCTYAMPTTDAGVVNPENVTVEYRQNGVPPAKKLTRVTNAAACVADGWYYDNNAAPTEIRLCPAQCTAVQADSNAKVQVLLGCLGG